VCRPSSDGARAHILSPLGKGSSHVTLPASFRTSHLSGIGGALGQIIQKLSTLSILWVGAFLVMDGKMTVGQLIAFQMLSGRVISPILRVVQLWQDFSKWVCRWRDWVISSIRKLNRLSIPVR